MKIQNIKSRTIISVALLMCSLLSGCAWHTRRYYSGSRRDLNKVAIILTDKKIFINGIDGKRAQNFFDEQRYEEWHLLPGSHVIKLYYSERIGYNRHERTSPTNMKCNFKAGYVYETQVGYLTENTVTIDIVCKGTIEEMFLEIAARKRSPVHWRELAEGNEKGASGVAKSPG